ncbi:MAG TPA: metalloregulator ArsR/SmtB family transcription factor [Acidimicrobiia bacterium]
MKPSATTDDLDATFNALANEHRRQIIHALALHPWSIGDLAEQRGLSLQAIHKHVKVLEEADLIKRNKYGRTNFLAIRRGALAGLQAWASEFHTYWGDDDESLGNYVGFLERKERNEMGANK